ncbi:MAG: hypothetical protein CM1200mP9_03000 [Gammaproteobacteria bacterium]|nr:MAG: hypothetical protein CM1200mP9_03000 [Gammaproteobacteria bacterium]
MSVIATDHTNVDWSQIVADLNRFLRLRTTPIGMKMFETVKDMEAIPRIRRPQTSIRRTRSSGKLVATVGPWASLPRT